MGVIKNLWVRIGGDATGAVKSFKSASAAGASAKESIKRSSAETKRSIRETFTSSVLSIKKYKEEVAQTKSAHQTATQNVDRLKDKISQLSSIYDTVKGATEGLDLSKPLSEQLVDAEKNLTEIESKRKKIEAELASLGASPKAASSKKTAALQTELEKLAEQSRFAEARLADLDRRAEQIGTDNIGYASAKGLEQLRQQLTATKNELNTTQMVVQETGQKLKNLGVAPTIGRALKGIGAAAAQAAGTGVKKLWSGLKSLAGSAVRGIAALPSKLLGIGKSASAGCGGLSKMVRSIRNIGAVSLGLRVASGMFGRLRSVISSYISQNEELNASVTAMKDQMGAALAPAINLVLQAMQRLMPVVTAVSNAISFVFTALFGKISATGKAISASAAAAGDAAEDLEVHGFDQITKESDNSSGGGSGGGSGDASGQIAEQSALVQKLTSWIQELKAAFNAGDWMRLGQIVGDGINNIVKSIDSVNIGTKVGTFVDNLFTTLYSALTTIDFFAIGSKVGQLLTAAMKRINWDTVGKTIGEALTAIPSIVVGFILDTDWATVAQSLSTCLISMLDNITEWFKSVDWLQIGQCIEDLIANVDWAGLARSLFECLGAALGALVSVLWGCIDDAVQSIKDYFSEKITAAGGDVGKGLWNGIIEGLGNIGTWIKENIFDPFIKGFCDIFQIHSPAKAVSSKSKFISEGLLSGIKSVDVFGKLRTWFKDNVLKPLTDGFSEIADSVSQVFSKLWDTVKGWINKLIGGVESMVNEVIKGINGLIRGFNKIASVGEYFGVNLTINELNTVSLPRLAKGAVVNEPTAAIIGEAGKEVVMPLENNTGWITKLAQQINQQGGGGTKSLALAIYFRSRKLAEYVIQDINQITRETGVCPIYV